jgi:transglycosylase-like protein with SLT domain/uncharacterized protein DUF5715
MARVERVPRTRHLVIGFVGGVAIALAVFALTRDSVPNTPTSVLDPGKRDPFAYTPAKQAAFERRAAAGYAHVLYAKSPGGAVATAERVNALRPMVDQVAAKGGVDANTLEGIVFLESAGRPDAIADSKLEGAVGLTQILAETGRNLLKMRVNPAAARKLGRQIETAREDGNDPKAEKLIAKRARVDQRFDPRKALEGTVRYLQFAKGKLGRDDLAVASYHMGVGNLQSVIADFRSGGGNPRSYAEVFFDSTPTHRAEAWRRLFDLGDDSSTYLWRVRAAEDIMHSLRADPQALAATAALQGKKNSAEEVLHPEGSTDILDDPDALQSAFDDGKLRTFPNDPAKLGLRRARQMGELAKKLGADPALYRGLRPEAYALAAYAAGMTQRAGGGKAPLIVTSTVRDRQYQRLLIGRNSEATQKYSLHTTGYAFDVLRRYRTRAQAIAFQFALDRLQALNLIAWVREPAAIHVTVSSDAKALLPLLKPAK